MPMTQRDFELIAEAIRSMRNRLQTDLDRCYTEVGAIVLDQLTEELAESCVARYPHFEREGFLKACQVGESSDRLPDRSSGEQCEGFHVAHAIGSNMAGGPSKVHARLFD